MVASITAPGGARLAPPRDELRQLCGRFRTLDGALVVRLLLEKAGGGDGAWQGRVKALHVLEALLRCGGGGGGAGAAGAGLLAGVGSADWAHRRPARADAPARAGGVRVGSPRHAPGGRVCRPTPEEGPAEAVRAARGTPGGVRRGGGGPGQGAGEEVAEGGRGVRPLTAHLEGGDVAGCGGRADVDGGGAWAGQHARCAQHVRCA